MAGPEDEMAAAAGGRGHLRASNADREYVIDTLKAAFVQGRLVKDEFDVRVRQTFAARTYAELAALTADLPAGMIEPQPPREHPSVPDQQPVSKALMWGACVIVVAAVGAMAASFLTNEFLLLVAGVLGILIAAPVAGTLMLDSWREKRSGGQLPPRAASGDQALEGKRDGGIGNDLTLPAASRDVRARRMKIGVPVTPVHACTVDLSRT